MTSDTPEIGALVKPEPLLTPAHQPVIARASTGKEELAVIGDVAATSSTPKPNGKVSFASAKPRRRRAAKSEAKDEKPRKRAKAEPKAEVLPSLTTEQKAVRKRKADLIQAKLLEAFPNPPETFLDHTDAFTLLVAVVLSAQCLDATVNSVTPALFAEAPTPAAMAALGIPRIKTLITKIGLNNAKSRYLHGLSVALVEQHNGEVPASLEEMEKLPGVGHKTASVVASHYFNIPAFPVDTHIHRLACRWGIGHPKSVSVTEAGLKEWFDDPNTWLDLHKRLILFGRVHCKATRHDMDECPICSFAATTEAREMNEHSYAKFVGAPSHADPYSIRGDPVEMGQVRPDQDNSSHESKNSHVVSQENKTPPHSPLPTTMAGEKTKTKSTPRVKSPRTITKSPSAKTKAKGSAKTSTKKPKPVVNEAGLRRSSRLKERASRQQ